MSIPTFFLCIIAGVTLVIPLISAVIYKFGKLLIRLLAPTFNKIYAIISASMTKYLDIWMVVGSFLIGAGILGYAFLTFQKLS